MKRPTSIFCAVAITALLICATSANAVVVSTLTSEAINGMPHAGPIIVAATGDLLETVGSVAAEDFETPQRNSTLSLFDGQITTGVSNNTNPNYPANPPNDPTVENAAFYAGNTNFIELDLDTTVNTSGYDISSITTIQRGDRFRPGQAYTVQLRPVGGSFSDLYVLADTGVKDVVNEVVISDDGGGLLGSGIDGIRFNFANTNDFGWTWYREIDVIGVPTVWIITDINGDLIVDDKDLNLRLSDPDWTQEELDALLTDFGGAGTPPPTSASSVPEPASMVLLLFGAMGLLGLRRRK